MKLKKRTKILKSGVLKFIKILKFVAAELNQGQYKILINHYIYLS